MARRFSQEFKQDAISYALSHTHEPIATIANKLGIGYSTLDKWIREASNNGSSHRPLTPEQQQILALEKENKHLREANEILKKCMCTFSPSHTRKVHVNSATCIEKNANCLCL